jgi:hypothetical protein
MGFFGNLLGEVGGGLVGGLIGGGKGKQVGSNIGGELGSLIPFKHGGAVGKRNVKALLHAGEYVLPSGVKPTKAQKKAVADKKKKGRK